MIAIKPLSHIIVCTVLLSVFTSCNYFTYSLRSKKNIRREQPSILVFERIVDFRIEQMGWPISKMDMMSKGIKYYEVFDAFPYMVTEFKVIDSNRMTFSFSEHIKDIEKHKETDLIDLHSYHGRADFYKENGTFLWKLKMGK